MSTAGQAPRSLLYTLLLGLAAGQPLITLTGPAQRLSPGSSVPFNCTAGPFSSRDLNVTWLKGSDEHPASAQYLAADGRGSYSVSSKAWVLVTGKDVLSQVTCRVAHWDLAEPLQVTMNLSQVLQVVPSLRITTAPSGTHLHPHQKVNLTCHVSRFYPAHLRLTWMENRHRILTLESPPATRNPDGTYSLEHTLPAEAALEGTEFACWVVQDERPPVQTNITLQAQGPKKGKGRANTISKHVDGPLHRSEPGTSIQLTYTFSGLHTRPFTVTCFKNSRALLQPQVGVFPSGDSYNVTSSVRVLLEAEDLQSSVVCQVEHKASVLSKAVRLDQYLRVSPVVTLSQAPISSSSMAVTCHVQRFYPQNVYLTWLEDCHVLKGTNQPTFRQNDDGSYSTESLVNVSMQRSERVLTCKVQHEEQPPIQASLILSRAPRTANRFTLSPGTETSSLVFVAFLLGLKVLLVTGFTVTYISRWWKFRQRARVARRSCRSL